MRKKFVLFVSALLIGITLIGGCQGGSMTATGAKTGDTVKVNYVGTLDDGTEFDKSEVSAPLGFTIGEGHMIPGFENGVIGMKVGETKTIKIPSAEAYGPVEPDRIMKVPKDRFPAGLNPEVGQQLQMNTGNQTIIVTVVAVNGTEVTLDANHPLAGKDLTFKITMVSITPGS